MVISYRLFGLSLKPYIATINQESLVLTFETLLDTNKARIKLVLVTIGSPSNGENRQRYH